MEPVEVVRELLDRIEARDWPAAGQLLAADVVVEWPVTAERIAGRDNFISIQAEYPEGWSIRPIRIFGSGEDVVSEMDVPHRDLGEFRAASFWKVRDGKIVEGREYWTSPGSEEPPAWRAKFTEPV
ncbi:ketosteroid isomerase-like protein [Kibdelosporangium banguiense]|uniref:Ketosteroid isomerase-like protein n=1 Tax=Kibdelosporangium banguiense TaxID=1365924 RepID=A0ABS4TIZ3_9PSEU|nr:nuclear transport factor 2 family protein [Kibdelosporangium banguiense]MBP2324393.1 ketosteroid isomerase-like protein [Kibdelosporangium banguiense]